MALEQKTPSGERNTDELPVAPLPVWQTRFFGREAEMLRLANLILSPNANRLLTLTGIGGIGKTRLAAEFTRKVATRLRYWCGFVSLADLTQPDQITPKIMQDLQLPTMPSGVPEDQIAAFFLSRDGSPSSPSLLVLDDLEQIDSADRAGGEPIISGMIRVWLERCPRLIVLCTSHQALGIPGEQEVPLGPLPVPDSDDSDLETLASIASVDLYVDRARLVQPDFELTEVNSPAVAALCQTLEGCPLALELAATWVRLEQELLPESDYSLTIALEQSWKLLTPAQQRLLSRLSVFRGGWTLQAAEVVCDAQDVLELLEGLSGVGLLESSETDNGEARYDLTKSIREFSQQKSEELGEWDALRLRHASVFASLAAQARPALRGPDQTYWLGLLEADHANLRAAMDCYSVSSVPEHPERVLRFCTALVPFWRAHGYLQEGHDRLRALVRRPDSATPTAARVDALNGAGELTTLLIAYDEAETFHAEALDISRELGYAPGEADALLGLATLYYLRRDYPLAASLFQDSLVLRQTRGQDWTEEFHRQWGESAVYHSLGNLALRRGKYAEAATHFESALTLRRQQGDGIGIAGTLGALGQVAYAIGDFRSAKRYVIEAMNLFSKNGQRWTVALCLTTLSQTAEAQKQLIRAVRLMAASRALREKYHFPLPPAEMLWEEERETNLRTLLGVDTYNSAWTVGWTLSWEQIVAQASLRE